jgi:hypothetical protein
MGNGRAWVAALLAPLGLAPLAAVLAPEHARRVPGLDIAVDYLFPRPSI